MKPDTAEKGYWVALAGAVVGTFLAVIAFMILWLFIAICIFVIGDAFDWFPAGSADELGSAFGYASGWVQILAVLIGSAVGIATALALGKRSAPILTGVLALPITVVAFLAMWGLAKTVGTMDYRLLVIVPPLVVPFLARWTALGLRNRSRRNGTAAATTSDQSRFA